MDPAILPHPGFYTKHGKLFCLPTPRGEDAGALFSGQCDSVPHSGFCIHLNLATPRPGSVPKEMPQIISRCSNRALGSFQLGGRNEKQRKRPSRDRRLRKFRALPQGDRMWLLTTTGEHRTSEDRRTFTTDNRTLSEKRWTP